MKTESSIPELARIPADTSANNPIAYFTMGVTLLVLLWGTYYQGLLRLPHQRLVAIALLLFGSFLAVRWGVLVIWRRPMLISLGVYLLGYLFSLPFSATPIEAFIGFAFLVAGGFAFFFGVWATRFGLGPARACDLISILSGVISWFGFLAMVKVIQFTDAFTGRLGSTFQYPNAMAALALMGVMASLGVAAERRFLGWRHLTLFASFLALLLTGSRGGQLAAAAVILGFLLMTFRRLPKLSFAVLTHAAGAVWAYSYVQRAMSASATPMRILGVILVISILVGVVLTLLELLFHRLQIPRVLLGGMAIAAFATAGIMLVMYGGSLVQRFTETLGTDGFAPTSMSDVSRVDHFKDAFRVLLDYPLGLGHRGWWAIYPQYQEWRYVINIVHSHLGETAVAGGVLGLAGLLGLWGSAAWNYISGLRTGISTPAWHALFWALAGLGLHSSVVDADMNFMVFALIAFAGWGVLEGSVTREQALTMPAHRHKSRWWIAGTGLLLSVMLVSLLVGDVLNNRAGELAASGKLAEARKTVGNSILLNPLQPLIRKNAASVALLLAKGPQEQKYLQEAREHWLKTIALDRFRPDLRVDFAAFLADQGEIAEAQAQLEKAVSLAPWQIRYWEKLLEFEIEAAKAYQDAGLEKEYREHLAAAHRVTDRIQMQQAKLPKRPFVEGLELGSPRLAELRGRLEAMGK